ncbi:MAG: hypothetical protein JSV34_04785 [Candidatus Omnitrophota bacterium]|nr:MAG: hypothetical protein JSV34_04785 [Candidatus Omnitrophota bacterium]
MAEQGKAKPKPFKVAVKVIVGLVLIILGILAIIRWWDSLWTVVRGCAGLFLFLAGAVTILIAKE